MLIHSMPLRHTASETSLDILMPGPNPMLEMYPEFKDPSFRLGLCKFCNCVIRCENIISFSEINSWFSLRTNGKFGFDSIQFQCPNRCAVTNRSGRARYKMKLKDLINPMYPVFREYLSKEPAHYFSI